MIMFKRFSMVFVVVFSVFLFGCGEQKIDGSSEKAFDKSIDPIIKSLSKEEAEKVFGGMTSLIMQEAMRLKGNGNPYQIFDGLTKKEFIEFAKTKKNPKK